MRTILPLYVVLELCRLNHQFEGKQSKRKWFGELIGQKDAHGWKSESFGIWLGKSKYQLEDFTNFGD